MLARAFARYRSRCGSDGGSCGAPTEVAANLAIKSLAPKETQDLGVVALKERAEVVFHIQPLFDLADYLNRIFASVVHGSGL